MAERLTACAAWQEDLAGWLMAQLPPAREAGLTEHLASCEVCRSEAESLLAVTAVSLALDPDTTAGGADEPPADLDATVNGTEQPPAGPDPIVNGADLPSADLAGRVAATISAERRARRLVRAGFAVLAGAAAGIVLVVALQRDGGPAPLHGEEVVFTVAPAGATVEAVVADDAGGSVVQLTATGLDPEVTFALWLSPPEGNWDDRVAAGTFRPDGDGDVDVRLRCALPADEYARVWATTPDGQIALDTE